MYYQHHWDNPGTQDKTVPERNKRGKKQQRSAELLGGNSCIHGSLRSSSKWKCHSQGGRYLPDAHLHVFKQPDVSVRHRRGLKMATVGGKLFYTSNSKKQMKHSCTNIQFSDALKDQPQPEARALGPHQQAPHSSAARATHRSSLLSEIK